MIRTVLVVEDELDLLFTIGLDLRLPDIDGWEVIRRLGETGSSQRS